MSVLDLVQDEFDPAIQARGYDYFDRGLVKIVGASNGQIVAKVEGGQLYHVEIAWSPEGLQGACTCTYATDQGACKHLWATLLAADQAGLLPDADDPHPSPPRGLRRVSDLLENLFGIKRRSVKSNVETSRPKPEHRPAPPAWKRQLAELHRAMQQKIPVAPTPHPWPANKRLVYLLDVNSTIYQNESLTINLGTQALDKAGNWGSPRPTRITYRQVATLPDEQDRLIVQMLSGLNSHSYYYGSSDDSPIENSFTLSHRNFDLILRRMCATGKCFAINEPDEEHPADDKRSPLTWDDGPPWEFWLALKPDANAPEERYVLEGELRRGQERMDCRAPLIVLHEGLLVMQDSISRLEHFGAFPFLAFSRHNEKKLGLAIPQADEMLTELLTMSALPRLDLPPELHIETISPPMRPHLKISAPPKKSSSYYYSDNKLMGQLAFDYGGRIIPEEGKVSLFDPASRTVLRRDASAEATASARLDELKFKREWSYNDSNQQRRLAPKKLNKVVLQLSSEGWLVEAEGKLYRQPGEFKIEVSSGIDWFELEGSLDFGGVSARLPRLLAALRRGEKTVQLDDGTVGILPDQWLAKYGLLARIAKDGDEEHVRFTRRQVGLLDALVTSMPQASCDAVFEQAREELRRFHGVTPGDAPESFVGLLRPYQRDGLGWLQFLNKFGFGGCLADDMGLGKTIQVLALLESRRLSPLQPRDGRGKGGAGKDEGEQSESQPSSFIPRPSSLDGHKPTLVVVPRSLVFNWIEEAKRFTPQLRILDHTGVGRAKSADSFNHYDVILTTYGTMRLDAPFLKDFTFDYAILDEAQAIKNGSSESAKAARLISADHRLALSGTPIQNHLGELWSLFEFLNPGMLGGASIFKVTGAGAQQIEKEGRELLSRALRPFILRRTKEQVAPELPEKTEQTIWCDLEPEQRKLYDELRDHYRASLLDRIAKEGMNKAKIQVLEALLRLRQAALHPGLLDKTRIDHASAKLDVLLPQLAEVIDEGHKVLVFSQFTSMLAIVKKRLDKQKIEYEYLDGQTRDRQARVERFQTDPSCKLFLISLKAGGLGLNLTAAEYVFLLDPWWNPAVESQAIDRAHRIGQTRRVFAYRIIAKDTVEQKVLELQAKKRDLADMILNADKSLISQLGRDDLELLLS